MLLEGISTLDLIPTIPLIIGNSYGNLYSNNNNRIPTESENNIKELLSSQKVINAMVEGKLKKIDDMARKIDRIAHDVDTHIKKFPT